MEEKLKKLREFQCYNSVRFEPCNICSPFNVIMCSKPVSRPRRVYPRSAARPSRDAHCTASVHLLVIRERWAHRAHQKCFSEFDSRPLRPRHKTDDLARRSPRDAFLRLNLIALSSSALIERRSIISAEMSSPSR